METVWSEKDTTTHQDHVIAHVLGATVLGSFILEEALYLLLDIGFIWMIYLDGEMGLLPHPVVVGELEVDDEKRSKLQTDIDALLRDGHHAQELTQLTHPPADCLIEEVRFYSKGEERKLLLAGQDDSLVVYMSLSSGVIEVREV